MCSVSMFMENGSGGFMGDLVFNGGKVGLTVGNQQWVVYRTNLIFDTNGHIGLPSAI